MATTQQTLTRLTQGMLYSSESDFPFEVLEWGKADDGVIKIAIAEHSQSTEEPVAVAIDIFFKKYIHRMEMSGDDVMMATIKGYQELHDFIVSNSEHAIVYRCGNTRVMIYIVLWTKEKEVFALATTSVET